MQARYYDPVIGRFLGEDPMDMLSTGMNPGYFNRYMYTMNNPVNYIDPTGKSRRGSTNANPHMQGVAPLRRQQMRTLASEIRAAGGGPQALPSGNNWTPTPRELNLARRHLERLRIENGQEGEFTYLYDIPGSGTSSGLPYTGRTRDFSGRNQNRRDSREGSEAEIKEIVPRSQERPREQSRLNRLGGVERTDNNRNEIRPENWPDHKIGPPPPPE